VAALISVLSLLGCSDSSGLARLHERPIVFTGTSAFQPAPHDIYTINADGSGLTNLTKGTFGDALFPRWSPDGSQIAFIVAYNGGWVMQRDGSGAHVVSNPNDCYNSYVRLSWSPSGDRLLGDCEMVEQFVINISDRTSYSLTQRWGNVADYPDWSPVDDRIAYLRGPNISVANLDGSNGKVVAADANEAAWSPDGKRVAFIRMNANQSQAIWIVNDDGTNEQSVTFPANRTISDDAPAWSPDGSRIVFWRTESDNPRGVAYLAVVNAGGGTPTRITADTLLATRADW
jgi:Tol biopolymer transport system component